MEEAAFKRATDKELGADKAYTIGAEETAVKTIAYCSIVCVKRLILGDLEGSGIGNSLVIRTNLNKCMWLK